MSKSLKFLYEFSVDKEVEKKVEEKKTDENGQEITVTRTEKVVEPIKFSILKPTRRLYDSAEIFLAKTISDYIKEGLMPITLIAKRFGNDGGVLTEKEAEHIEKLQKDLEDQQKRLVDMKLDGTPEKDATIKEKTEEEKAQDSDKRTSILIEMLSTQSEIDRLRNSYISLYENTAEMKARKKAIEWWITQMSYTSGENPVEFFQESNFEKRYEKYVNILDGDDEFNKRVANKFSFLISTWFSAGNNSLTLDDFKSADQHFELNFEK